MITALNKLSMKPSTLVFVLVLLGIFLAILMFPKEHALWIAVVIVVTRIHVGEDA